MATKKSASNTDFTAEVKEFAADAQSKAKQAYAKGSAALSDAAEFTKGNAEALVASGKIVANGMQMLSKTAIAEGKSAMATVKADVEELSAVKSPTALVTLQSKIVRRNVDSAFAIAAKNSQALFALFDQALAPLTPRAELAMGLFKKAA